MSAYLRSEKKYSSYSDNTTELTGSRSRTIWRENPSRAACALPTRFEITFLSWEIYHQQGKCELRRGQNIIYKEIDKTQNAFTNGYVTHPQFNLKTCLKFDWRVFFFLDSQICPRGYFKIILGNRRRQDVGLYGLNDPCELFNGLTVFGETKRNKTKQKEVYYTCKSERRPGTNSYCYTSQLKYVFWLEENVSRVIGQNFMISWRPRATTTWTFDSHVNRSCTFETAANLYASRRQANNFYLCIVLFWVLDLDLNVSLGFASGNIEGLGETKLTVSLKASH